jgi:hypothetical protein
MIVTISEERTIPRAKNAEASSMTSRLSVVDLHQEMNTMDTMGLPKKVRKAGSLNWPGWPNGYVCVWIPLFGDNMTQNETQVCKYIICS